MRANFKCFHLIEVFKRYHECIELYSQWLYSYLKGFFPRFIFCDMNQREMKNLKILKDMKLLLFYLSSYSIFPLKNFYFFNYSG